MEQLLKQIEIIKAAVIKKENKDNFDSGFLSGLELVIVMIEEKMKKQ